METSPSLEPLTIALAVTVALLPLLGLAVLVLRGGRGARPEAGDDRPPAAARPAAGDLEGEARALVAQGRKLEAIKRWREATGLGLREAKDAVEALERGGPVAPPRDVDPAAPRPAGADHVAEARALLAQGRKIEAIKVWREATGLGLREAKDAVEALER